MHKVLRKKIAEKCPRCEITNGLISDELWLCPDKDNLIVQDMEPIRGQNGQNDIVLALVQKVFFFNRVSQN